jgi:hypothetical protein
MTSPASRSRPARRHGTRLAGGLHLALAGSLLAAACGGTEMAVDRVTTTTAPATTTTTTTIEGPAEDPVEAVVAPLTGLPVEGEALLRRPALFVKVDNHPEGRPPSRLADADIVFEYLAEGVTRFGAVYHTNSPDHVGPVRSSRTSDFDLLRALGTPLYASSGGNNYVAAAIRQLPVVNLTAITRTEYYRDSTRKAPHNLFVDTADLFALAPEDATAPRPWFAYRGDGDPLPEGATPFAGEVTIRWRGSSPIVTYTWDGPRAGWLRTQDGFPHVQDDGSELVATNVVILVAEYGRSAADSRSSELISTGEGEAIVLTDGHLIVGRWLRPSAENPPELRTEAGDEILLRPGTTWVLWPEWGDVTY